MQIKDHPTFAQWFQRTFFKGWCLLVITLLPFCFASVREHSVFPKWLFIVFLLQGISFLVYLWLKVKSIACPECQRKLQTQKNKQNRTYSACCHYCQIEWNLGIGYRHRL